MIPPTPTFLPPVTPSVDTANLSIWEGASTAVQYMNLHQDVVFIVQVIVLVIIVLGGLFMLIRELQQLIEDDGDA